VCQQRRLNPQVLACVLLKKIKNQEFFMDDQIYQKWLMLFREDLRARDAKSLAKNVQAAGLDIVLDMKFEDLVCEEDARQVAVLIGSIGEENSDNKLKYIRIKNTYQYLSGQIDIEPASMQCCVQNSKSYDFYKALLESIKNSEPSLNINKIFATADDIEFGIKLLINTGHSHWIFDLLKKWQSIDKTDLPWLKTCRYIVKRGQKASYQIECKNLSITCKKLIDLAPKNQAEVRTQMIIQWSELAYNSKDGLLARIASSAAIKIDSSFDQCLLYSKALILNGDLTQANQSLNSLLLKVTSEDKKTFLAKYDAKEKGIFDFKSAEATLKTANEILRSKGLKPFLAAGSLLGYARDGEILKHDKDVDIGIIGWENQFLVAQALLETGLFSLDLKNITGPNRFTISTNDLRNGTALDIFLFHDLGDCYLYGIDFDIGYTLNFKFTKFNLEEVNFLGENFYAPSNIDLHLKENYDDWREPIPGYVVPVESPAVVINPITYQLTTYLEIFKNITEADKHHKIIRIIDHIRPYKSEYIPEELQKRITKWCSS